MTDEELKKEKYRCEIQSGTEGLVMADLFIRTAVAHIIKPVRLRQGEYIPTDLVDFGDLKKSRLAGALLKCIEKGWISVENPSEKIEKVEQSTPEMIMPKSDGAITELKAGLINPEDVTNLVADVPQPKGINPFPKEKEVPVKEVITLKEARTANTFAVTEQDLNSSVPQLTNYEDFKGLRYFQKLKAIKESTDKVLLKSIMDQDSYPQLVHNSKSRLLELNTIESNHAS